ncbi:hypothetical protein ACQ4PT_024642 [Festuca glaucescens]
MFSIGLSGLKEALSRMNNAENEENNSNERSRTTDSRTETTEFGDIPATEDAVQADLYKHVLPPPVAKTKGNRNKNGSAVTGKVSATVPARPQPEVDERGKPKGKKLCSTCKKIDGHNSRTCKRRQMAAKLLKKHKHMYGASASPDDVKICIKNLLAKNGLQGDKTENLILETDDELDFEDETEDEEYMSNGEDVDDGEESEQSGDEQFDDEEQTYEMQTENIQSPPLDVNVHQSQRKCGLCNERAGHYTSTCPKREEILQKQLSRNKTSEPRKMNPQGKEHVETMEK